MTGGLELEIRELLCRESNCFNVARRWPRYLTILVSTRSCMCLFSQVQTVSWWTWKENTVRPTSDM